MARIFSSGFELNSPVTAMEWVTASSPTGNIVTTNVRSGTYSFNPPTGATTMYYLAQQFSASEVATNMYFRVYFLASTLPSTENQIMNWNDAVGGATPSVIITLDSSGILRLYDEDGQISGTTTLTTNQWYRIEIHIDTTPAASDSDVIEARVDDTIFSTSSTRNIVSTNLPYHFSIGKNLGTVPAGVNETTGNFYYDDVAVNDTTGSDQNSWCGPGRIIHLRPNAAGDVNTWTTGSYTDIDEVTPDDATTYMNSGTATSTVEVNVDNNTVINSFHTINVLQVGARAMRNGGSESTGPYLRLKATSGGTVFETTTQLPALGSYGTNLATTGNRGYALASYYLPGTSTPWSYSDLNTTQIGARHPGTSTQTHYMSTLWLLIDYTIPVRTFSTDYIDITFTTPVTAVYSHESLDVLPTDESQLTNAFDATDYTEVATDDTDYVDSTGDNYYNAFVFTNNNANNTDPITVTWRGKTDLSPAVTPVIMEIYNYNSDTWESADSDSATAINTEFDLVASIPSSPGNYYGPSNAVTVRVYQENT